MLRLLQLREAYAADPEIVPVHMTFGTWIVKRAIFDLRGANQTHWRHVKRRGPERVVDPMVFRLTSIRGHRHLSHREREKLAAEASESRPTRTVMSGLVGFVQFEANDHVEATDNHLDLTAALEKLTPDQADAIRLHYLDGMSQADIAELRGKSQPSVSKLLARGIQELRKHMGVTVDEVEA